MLDDKYKRAYTEVIEVLNNLSKEEYEKIPKNRIEYYKKNMDRTYEFKINPSIPVENQRLSKEASAILVSLFLEYFINEKQRLGLQEMLNKNNN